MDLEVLCNLENIDEVVVYIDEVVSKMERPERKIVGFENLQPYDNFIFDDMLITNVDARFKIEKNDYLYIFADGLRKSKITDPIKAAGYIYQFIGMYFGKEGSDEIRENIYYASEGIPDLSLLRNKNGAVCSERAALVQNLFTFLGFQSYYIIGRIKTLEGGDRHAFNVINMRDKYYIYDSASDVNFINDNTVTGSCYIQEISEEKLKELFLGKKEIEMMDYQIRMVNNEKRIIPIGKRMYMSSSAYDLDKTQKKEI